MDEGSWHCTGGSEQDHFQEKEIQKGKMVVWGGLANSWEKIEAKGKGEKERYTHLNAEFQRIARRDKKDFLSDQCKEIEDNNRMGKISDLFKKILDIKRTFHARWAHSCMKRTMWKKRRPRRGDKKKKKKKYRKKKKKALMTCIIMMVWPLN